MYPSISDEESYWEKEAKLSETEDLIEGELCFGLFYEKNRLVLPASPPIFFSYAYISDVFVIEKYQGQGLATWLLECVLAHPQLQNMESWMLLTDDAHGLYEKIGFKRVSGSADQMIKINPNFVAE
ncbi:MAG: GNAT family N-acetyltransferase [Saprospiraceae bacterium]